jgi:hypothetical protein
VTISADFRVSGFSDRVTRAKIAVRDSELGYYGTGFVEQVNKVMKYLKIVKTHMWRAN